MRIISMTSLGLTIVAGLGAQQPAPTSQLPSSALGMIVYPAKGQTKEVQLTDEQGCYAWAKEQTGIDPAAVKANPDSAAKAAGAATADATTGAAVKGAAKSALGGAAVRASAGDAGTGARV